MAFPHRLLLDAAGVVRAAEETLGGSSAPLVCTDGQPSAACDELLRQLGSASGTTTHHSGDFDWGGVRIGGLLRRRHDAHPWRHSVTDYGRHAERCADREQSLRPPRGSAPDGYGELWEALISHRIPVWQEDLLEELLGDLAS